VFLNEKLNNSETLFVTNLGLRDNLGLLLCFNKVCESYFRLGLVSVPGMIRQFNN